jgi:penicillin-binding protein 1A
MMKRFKIDQFRLRKYIHNKFLLWIARIVVFIIIYISLLETNFLWLTGYMPDRYDLNNPEVAVASDVFTVDSVFLGRFFSENRTPIELKNVSPWLVKSLISTEDIRFYDHHGFDFFSMFGSAASTVKGDNRGGSTITQQLAKNMFQTRAASSQGLLGKIPGIRTLIYKSKEWVTAIKLEFFYTKEEILEMYFNTVEFGNNWYGIKVASQNYFDKRPLDLSIQESALMAGVLKATSTYNPIRNKEQALARRNTVLGQLLKYNELTSNQYDSISKLDIVLNRKAKETATGAGYIRDIVEQEMKKWCAEKSINLYEDGLKIYLTIDSRMQKYAEEAVHSHLASMQQKFDNFWGKRNPWTDDEGREIPMFIENNVRKTALYKDLKKQFKNNEDTIETLLSKRKPMKIFSWKGPVDTVMSTMDSLRYYARVLQVGMMSYDPFHGVVRAYVGGVDFRFFKYDHVMKGKRQPGSTFKTFAYTAAIDQGYTPCDEFVDKPVKIKYDNQLWEPKNASHTFSYRRKTLRRALSQSINTITAQLTEEIGWNTVADYAYRLGIKSKLDEVPSISLGSSDVNVFELTNAYGTILADGIYREPQVIASIYDKEGKKLADFTAAEKRIISSETAWLVRYMLLGCIQEPGGTSQALWGYNLFENGNEVTGKTGTTSNNSDAWYVGMSQNLVTGVWVGTDYRSVHFRNSTGQGSRLALPIFAKYLQAAIKDKHPLVKTGRFPLPEEKITKPYLCYSPESFVVDSLDNDSLFMELPDSTFNPVIDTLKND